MTSFFFLMTSFLGTDGMDSPGRMKNPQKGATPSCAMIKTELIFPFYGCGNYSSSHFHTLCPQVEVGEHKPQ